MRCNPVSAVLLLSLAALVASCTTLESYEANRKATRLEQLKQERQERIARKRAELEAQRKAGQEAAEPAVRPADPLDGLAIPSLPVILEKPEQVESVLAAYKGFASSAAEVHARVKAYGLRPQLATVQKLRASLVYWEGFFGSLRFMPRTPSLTVKDLEAFYQVLDEPDTQVMTAVSGINSLIDKERSVPWKENDGKI